MEQGGNVSPSTKAPKACLRSNWQRADTSWGGYNAAASIWNCAIEQVGNVSLSTKEPDVPLRSYWRWDRIQCDCIGLELCYESGELIGVVPGEVFKSAAFVLSFHLLLSIPLQSLPSICFSANPYNLFPPSASQQTLTISSLHLLRRIV